MFQLIHLFKTRALCTQTKKSFFSIAASYYHPTPKKPRCWCSTKPSPYPRTQPFSANSPWLNNNNNNKNKNKNNIIMDRNNEGLVLKRQLQETGQSKWGFVIYRCTYGDDKSWDRFMNIVNERVRASMDFYGTLELMDNLDWKVQDDAAVLDGASKAVVRKRFREEWAAASANDDGGGGGGQPEEPKTLFVPRFTYCIHVDAESLKSVVEDAPQPPAPDLEPVGYVNLIIADPTSDKSDGDEDEMGDSAQRADDDDIGWMKVAVDGLAPRTYSLLGESGGWEICYVPPPDIAVP